MNHKKKRILLVYIACITAPFLAVGLEKNCLFSCGFEKQDRVCWALRNGEKGGKSLSEITDAKSHSGKKSLKWDFDFSGMKKENQVYAAVGPRMKLKGKPKRFYIWVYGDKNNRNLNYRILSASGRIWQNKMVKINWEGWRRLDGKIEPKGYSYGKKEAYENNEPFYPVQFTEFIIDGKKYWNSKTSGTVYLDDFRVFSDLRETQEF